jgi:NADH-quinone oxidoreductase subunit G
MKTLIVNGITQSFDNERNLLEVIRKCGIEMPTFCYHSELSIYGACRLCVVEIEGRGIQTSCTIPPEDGMVVRTNTDVLRRIRRNVIELLLASDKHNCPTCQKSLSCKLQDTAKKLGVTSIRYKSAPNTEVAVDLSSPAIFRDPNKCILCGDCVRACNEIQGIGAIDFVGRGANTVVAPAFNKGLSEVDCVDCGQCVRICPTAALIPNSQVENVWKALSNTNKRVVVHFAPAVRVAIGEEFGLEIGQVMSGQLIKALRLLGFAKIFDTSFAADLTIFEEATEFLTRKANGGIFPLFTSCCPA